MNFDGHHYVPILKVKRGEKATLQLLSESVRTKITPLFEIVERKDKPLDNHLNNMFRGLAIAVSGFRRCFIDARELAPDGPAVAAEVFRRATSDGIAFTPVTGVSRTADVESALENRTRGVALRLERREFEVGNLGEAIRAFLDRYTLNPEDIDLILDLGSVDDMIADGVEAFAAAFLADVPDHTRWRTLTLSASAFPLSMKSVDRFSDALVDRADWMPWRDSLHARRATLSRLPTYSDCAIQHPKGVEGYDPRIMPMSAAIRYTTGDFWLLIKGESRDRTALSVQFPSLARSLVSGSLREYYYGADHCSGCEAIKRAADGERGFARPEDWRRLGTIHHLTTVVQDLGALTWP
jgi:hypothetical protein